MEQSQDRLNLSEQEVILNTLLSTHVDQWTHLTNLLHTYPDVEKITRDDVTLAFHTDGARHRCTTPHLIFNFYLKRTIVGVNDELIVNVGVGDDSCLYGLQNLTHYRDYCNATGIDREALASVVECMAETLGQYLSLESELRPWLKLRTLGMNATSVRKEIDEGDREQKHHEHNWRNSITLSRQ